MMTWDEADHCTAVQQTDGRGLDYGPGQKLRRDAG